MAGAGELVVHDGKIVGISDRSGHYHPGLRQDQQVLKRLQQGGVNLRSFQFEGWVTPTPVRASDILKLKPS
ncbi:MAG: hypothetical protein IPJ65_25005 [Archangiaceae bacterium]|nr:hypothetical protein [Archangiaceae bacterium]